MRPHCLSRALRFVMTETYFRVTDEGAVVVVDEGD